MLNHELMSSPIPDTYKLLFKSTVVISRFGLALWAYIKHSVTKLFRGAAAQESTASVGTFVSLSTAVVI